VKCMLGNRWRDGVLDSYRGPGEIRLEALAWLPLARIDDLHFSRPRSLRLVWNYVREIGVGATLTKVASRHEERSRNDTYLVAGLGRVLEAPLGAGWLPGSMVEFIATRQPAAIERVAVVPELLRPAKGELSDRVRTGTLLVLARRFPSAPVAPELLSVAGWSPESGTRIGADTGKRLLALAHEELAAAGWDTPQQLSLEASTPVTERRVRSDRRSDRALSAVLFGYGNYAKTAILPSLPSGIRLDAIHEIDPLQMPRKLGRRVIGGHRVAWDTAPGLRPDERYDVGFIAGFHHSHAPLAIDLMAKNGVPVVEKPIATTEEQLHRLLEAMRHPGRRMFACFHKRYSRFNDIARQDLGVARGGTISYHGIVYEVPLPKRHWYRWPNSRTCLLSNGCHWLDHFLFLNDFAAVDDVSISVARDGTVCSTVSLENGAFFSMTLTRQGSERLGVRDHVELRANGVTVTIEDGAYYRAESRDRVLRRCRENRLTAYRAMYDTICRKILSGEDGDSLRSLQASAGLALRLDRLLLDHDAGRDLGEEGDARVHEVEKGVAFASA
jgi:predicted dehydrogenase